MSAVWYRSRAELRTRWKSVLALAVALAVPVVLLVANAVTFVPGRIAVRLRPAAVLRSE